MLYCFRHCISSVIICVLTSLSASFHVKLSNGHASLARKVDHWVQSSGEEAVALLSLVVVDMQLVLLTSVAFSTLSNTVSTPEEERSRSNPTTLLAATGEWLGNFWTRPFGPIEIDCIRHSKYELQSTV